MARHDDIRALKHIAKILHDQITVYAQALEHADEPPAIEAISAAIAQRRGLLPAVEARIRTLGAEPTDARTLTGYTHQVVTAIHGAIDSSAEMAIEEVEKGEDEIRDQLRKFSRDQDVSAEAQAFFRDLLDDILPMHNRITALKHAYEARP